MIGRGKQKSIIIGALILSSNIMVYQTILPECHQTAGSSAFIMTLAGAIDWTGVSSDGFWGLLTAGDFDLLSWRIGDLDLEPAECEGDGEPLLLLLL